MHSRPNLSLMLSVLAVLALGFMNSSCALSNSTDNGPTPVVSGPPRTALPMPPIRSQSDIGWVSLDGQRSRLSDYSGKILVVDFYATWCLPCRKSIPQLLSLQQRLGSKGLEVVGLHVGGADDRVKVAEFARELGIKYALGFPDKALTDLFLSDDQTIPQTFVFGRDGHLIKRFIGYDEATGQELEKMVENAVTNH
jgi:thiol-disulfide isomerase/thioredoxin